MKAVTLYADGACKGNPGKGGWGVWLQYGVHERALCGGEVHTTNNRMELRAVIEGLNALKQPCAVDVFTDSRYVQQGISEWIHAWQQRGWKTSNNQAVKNADLWQALLSACAPHQVRWHWVKGHAGDAGNERADALANAGILTLEQQ